MADTGSAFVALGAAEIAALASAVDEGQRYLLGEALGAGFSHLDRSAEAYGMSTLAARGALDLDAERLQPAGPFAAIAHALTRAHRAVIVLPANGRSEPFLVLVTPQIAVIVGRRPRLVYHFAALPGGSPVDALAAAVDELLDSAGEGEWVEVTAWGRAPGSNETLRVQRAADGDTYLLSSGEPDEAAEPADDAALIEELESMLELEEGQ